MPIQTEPIGSIPRPPALLDGVRAFQDGRLSQKELDALYDSAIRDTIERFEATGSPVITDGEQTKPSFVTYPLSGLKSLAPDGAIIPFADGHTRRLPRLTAGPFHYMIHADQYWQAAKRYAHVPVKQAVISASALSLLYPQNGIEGYSREAFLSDLLRENEADIRRCLEKGVYKVQIDFTEGRLAVKLDPTGGLLKSFIDLNNRVLDRFSAEERKKIGVHTCPGGDQDSAHSADVDYAELLPRLFELKVGNFYIQLAGERDRARILGIIKEQSKVDQQIFIGVTDPINSRLESPEEIRDRVLEAADYIPPGRLGTTDDCGFSPFGDDTSTSRETAFEKIRARVTGTALASKALRV
ncbi:MAG TPA: cobalamin-independent methionine synthase II family protein [Nitrospiria bacterium]